MHCIYRVSLNSYVHFVPFSLSSLVANSLLFTPNNMLLTPKTPLFNGCFAPLNHVFYGSKRFYLYHCSGFLCLSSCIQQHFALRLAAKRIAFSGILACVQHQNALRLAAKRTAFSSIMHYIQQQIARQLVQMTAFLNINSFCRIHMLTSFCIKTNLRENRFFAARLAIGGEKGHS